MNKHVRFVRGWVVFGVLAGFVFAASAGRADPTAGLCNSIAAQALGNGLQVANQGPTFEQCTEIGIALQAVFSPPCLDELLAGKLGILNVAGNAPFKGEISPLGTKICTGLDLCGFLPLGGGFCPGF